MKKYNIFCQVSRGVTGTRTSFLKNLDGTAYETENYSEAKEKALELNKKMNENSKAATFNYWVEED